MKYPLKFCCNNYYAFGDSAIGGILHWKIVGSNDGTAWTLLDTQQLTFSLSYLQQYTFTNTTY